MNRIAKWMRRHPVRSQRMLEILPGFTSWFLILFPIWGSLVMPEIVAYYIIAFSVYWFYRSMAVASLSIFGYAKLRAAEAYDWMGDVDMFPHWRKIHHIIVIPTYKEPIETLERTLDNLSKQTYPLKNLHVMLSFEDREGEAGKEKARKLGLKYSRMFGDLWTTVHPDLPGEVKGKSSNTSWGAKEAKRKLVDEKGVDIEHVTITSEDADVLLHESYFACLTYHYLDDPDRYLKIWQGVLFFYNNIWKVPWPVRAHNSISSISSIYINTRRDRLINFSTYSASLYMIDKIGYWDVDVIPEDWRLFFKAFFAFEGKVSVQSLFLRTLADAAEAPTKWGSVVSQYQQIKRWAWGVSDTPYLIKNWVFSEKVPFWEKTIRVMKAVQDHFLWPVNWFAVTLGALIPPLVNKEFSRTIIGKTLPQVTSGILTLCLVALAVMLVLNFKLRPRRSEKVGIVRRFIELGEFIILPVIGFFFTALPSIDAHTRLMLGKYMEYRVTEKVKPE